MYCACNPYDRKQLQLLPSCPLVCCVESTSNVEDLLLSSKDRIHLLYISKQHCTVQQSMLQNIILLQAHHVATLAVTTRLAGWTKRGKKMRPDMMIVEMTDTEQRTYLPLDTDTGSRLPNLQRTHAQQQSKESYDRGGRLLQRCLIFRKGQGERTATCQAGGSIEAIWI